MDHSSLRLTALAATNGTARKRGAFHPWLHGMALFTVATVLILICSGGLVTSKGAGLTVPDWPTSYGYNMFTFPISRWVGGIFHEHTHRLLASGVGLLTVALMALTLAVEQRRWVRWLAVGAVAAVICQGVLGGLRVVWLKDYIGIFHACLAQAFLAAVSLLALVTSKFWLKARLCLPEVAGTLRQLRFFALAATVLIYVQLALGASMRHAHAGLSIPDFPAAYGKIFPPTDPATMVSINAAREAVGEPVTTRAQIHLQLLHRFGAVLVSGAVIAVALLAWGGGARMPSGVRRLGMAWPILIGVQITLGIYTIWTRKAADMATAHVAVGAISFVWGVLLCTLLLNDARAATFAQRAARTSAGEFDSDEDSTRDLLEEEELAAPSRSREEARV